jgi:hypothetical protein
MTPLGAVKNDRELGDLIKKNSSVVDYDEEAHMFEHSAEVQLPFLQTLFKEVNAVEIAMTSQSYEVAVDVATAVWKACKDAAKDAVIIASSDFTHYEPAETAKETDRRALKLIEQMKPQEFIELVEEEELSICGYGAIAAAMIFAQKNEAKSEVLKYGSSGDTTGDYGSVVGYASVVFQR